MGFKDWLVAATTPSAPATTEKSVGSAPTETSSGRKDRMPALETTEEELAKRRRRMDRFSAPSTDAEQPPSTAVGEEAKDKPRESAAVDEPPPAVSSADTA